ncbi:MAG: hypothetical protein ACI90V_005427 [Bacillariaceae sp.]|jgi:hypothetical protein
MVEVEIIILNNNVVKICLLLLVVLKNLYTVHNRKEKDSVEYVSYTHQRSSE